MRTAGDTGAAGLTVWAYTAQFGNGFSGTLSAESPAGSQPGCGAGCDTRPASSTLNGAAVNDNAFSQNGGGNGFRFPDVIANLRVDQAWGFVGVSGAIHDASGAYYVTGNNVNNGHPADRLGWAVAAGGLLNLGGGSQAGINFAYAEGATGYVTNIGSGMSLYNASTSVGVGWMSDGVFATGDRGRADPGVEHQRRLPAHLEPEVADIDLRRLCQHRLQRQRHGV